MIDLVKLNQAIVVAKNVTVVPEIKFKILSVLDYTRLMLHDTPEKISAACLKVTNLDVHVAAVCLYPEFVHLAQVELKNTPIKVATVINFPSGNESLEQVTADLLKAIQDGALEIDLVFPYQKSS